EHDHLNWTAGRFANDLQRQKAASLRDSFPFDPRVKAQLAEMINAGNSLLVPNIASMLGSFVRDGSSKRAIEDIGIGSLILVPMKARGKTFGVFVFMTADSGRRFSEADLHYAEKITAIGALALDNLVLYRSLEERNE